MKYVIWNALLLGVAITQMTNDQALIYKQWNHLFQNELQLELQTQSPDSSSGGPPSNPDSEENKMLQKLYEQEESMEGIKRDILKLQQDKIKQDLADEQERLDQMERNERNERKEKQMQQEKNKKKERDPNAERGRFDDDETFDDDSFEYIPGDQLKKPLYKYESQGNDGQGLMPANIILRSNLHKIALVSIMIGTLLVMVLIRQRMQFALDKYFVKALQVILLDSTMIITVHLLAIALYYFSYYDAWYLFKKQESDTQRTGIRLVQIKQLIPIPDSPLMEIYYIDVYAYLLISMLYFVVSLLCNIFYIMKFDTTMRHYREAELEWTERQDYAFSYQKKVKDLLLKQRNYEQLLLNPRRPAAQSANLLVLIKQIQFVQKIIDGRI